MNDHKFMNVYVENAIGTIHEYINVILQLKTKLKLASDMVVEKDEVINNLAAELENSKHSDEELSESRRTAKSWEEQFNAMKSKVSHMDTLTSQYNDLKKAYVESEQQIVNLKNEINNVTQQKDAEIKAIREATDNEVKLLRDEITKLSEKPKSSLKKSVINTKNTVKSVIVGSKEEIDDF